MPLLRTGPLYELHSLANRDQRRTEHRTQYRFFHKNNDSRKSHQNLHMACIFTTIEVRPGTKCHIIRGFLISIKRLTTNQPIYVNQQGHFSKHILLLSPYTHQACHV